MTARVKRFAPKTRALAADVVLRVAVDEATRLIVEGDWEYADEPEHVLIAAGYFAELLLDGI